MKKPNLGYYVQTINHIVTSSEEVGEEMNGSYELIREAIDTQKLETLTREQLTDIKALFAGGTEKYKMMLTQIQELRPPARVMGIHRKLEKAFADYVQGCQEMVDALQPDEAVVNTELFNLSEKKQDEATDTISFSIQRMTNLLMK